MTTPSLTESPAYYLRLSTRALVNVMTRLDQPPGPLGGAERHAVDAIRAELRRRELGGEPATVDGAPVVFATARRGREFWNLEFDCPWCPRKRSGRPKTHFHGGGPIAGDPRDFSGHRASHCIAPGAPGSYFVLVREVAS